MLGAAVHRQNTPVRITIAGQLASCQECFLLLLCCFRIPSQPTAGTGCFLATYITSGKDRRAPHALLNLLTETGAQSAAVIDGHAYLASTRYPA